MDPDEQARIEHALQVAADGVRCQTISDYRWLVDRMVRILAGGAYDEFVRQVERSTPPHLRWMIGLAPPWAPKFEAARTTCPSSSGSR